AWSRVKGRGEGGGRFKAGMRFWRERSRPAGEDRPRQTRGAWTLSGLPQRPGLCARSRLCVRERSFERKDLHVPRQQNDFASRDSKGAGSKTHYDRQNRSPSEIRFEEGPAVLGPFAIGKRQ